MKKQITTLDMQAKINAALGKQMTTRQLRTVLRQAFEVLGRNRNGINELNSDNTRLSNELGEQRAAARDLFDEAKRAQAAERNAQNTISTLRSEVEALRVKVDIQHDELSSANSRIAELEATVVAQAVAHYT